MNSDSDPLKIAFIKCYFCEAKTSVEQDTPEDNIKVNELECPVCQASLGKENITSIYKKQG